jgi:hypothetical protein
MSSISTRKLIAFAMAVCALALVPYLSYKRYQQSRLPRSFSEGPSLLASRIGDYSMVDRWANPIDGYTGIEQGATYQCARDAQPLQYDMWLGNLDFQHNGIACYLARGSHVIWQRSRQIKARDTEAQFGLALLRDDSIDGPVLKLVAATQCSFGSCEENALVAHGWEFSSRGLFNFFSPQGMALPLSITVAAKDAIGSEQQLLGSLEHFLRGLPLRPVQDFSVRELQAAH